MSNGAGEQIVNKFKQFYLEQSPDKVDPPEQIISDKENSLLIDFESLNSFDSDIAADYIANPSRMRMYAQEALRLLQESVEWDGDQSKARIYNLPRETTLDELGSENINELVALRGVTSEVTDVQTRISTGSFECQRCGTITRLPQRGNTVNEPEVCQGCEKKGPFELDEGRSEFTEAQSAILNPISDGAILSDSVELRIHDDITGAITSGETVIVVGEYVVDETDMRSREIEVVIIADSFEAVDPPDALTVPETTGDIRGIKPVVQNAITGMTLLDQPDEFETQTKVLTPLLQAIGWEWYSPQFRVEYSPREVDTDRTPDYVLENNNQQPQAVVEAKRWEKRISPNHVQQVKSYMREFCVDRAILTNGVEYRFYFRTDTEDPQIPDPIIQFIHELPDNTSLLAHFSPPAIGGGSDYLSTGDIAQLISDFYMPGDGAEIPTEDILDQFSPEFAPADKLAEAIYNELATDSYPDIYVDGASGSDDNDSEATVRFGEDPNTGTFDAEIVETGTSKSELDQLDRLKKLVADIEAKHEEGAPVDIVIERADEIGMDASEAEDNIEELKYKGEVYEPATDHLRST